MIIPIKIIPLIRVIIVALCFNITLTSRSCHFATFRRSRHFRLISEIIHPTTPPHSVHLPCILTPPLFSIAIIQFTSRALQIQEFELLPINVPPENSHILHAKHGCSHPSTGTPAPPFSKHASCQSSIPPLPCPTHTHRNSHAPLKCVKSLSGTSPSSRTSGLVET